jgi:hypothetical protein
MYLSLNKYINQLKKMSQTKSFAIETIKEQEVLNQSGLLKDDDEWLSINTISKITERIFCSGFAVAQSPVILEKNAIKGVLTIGDITIPPIKSNYMKNKISHLQLSIEDDPKADLSVHFDIIYKFINQFNEKKYNVLVHCDQGISRSPAVILYFLIAKIYKTKKPDKPALSSIYKLIKEKRNCIDINPGFIKSIEKYEASLR